MKTGKIFEPYFDDLLKENFLFVAPYIIFVYPLLSIVDAQLAKGNFLFFLFLRVIFLLPLITSYFIVKKHLKSWSIYFHVYAQFFFLGLGVCTTSYFLGGLSSDYYFGLIIISFLQYTFLPLKARNGLILDIFYMLAFFTINTYEIEFSEDLLLKQMTNFVSFVVFKYLASRRSQKLIYGSMHRYSLDKELNDNEEAAQLFGELCHLISNPLFISQSLVKKASLITKESEIENMLSKSITAHERISQVVKKMLEFNRTKAGIKTYRNRLVNREVDRDNKE